MPFKSLLPSETEESVKRIITDHLRGVVFLITDGVYPSNKEAGYILRRLMRRVIAYHTDGEEKLLKKIVEQYKNFYPEFNEATIISVWNEEYTKFANTVQKGLSELKKVDMLDAQLAFKLYESYGLPYEIIKDFAGDKAKNLNREDFDAEFKKHQEISRAGQEKKFGGHGLLLDTGELKAADEKELKIVTRLHTATHMLQAALRQVLGNSVKQAGSDITVERNRFDFTFDRNLTPEEIKKVEDIVNKKIREDLPMQKIVLPKEEAEKTGALYFFREKYPEKVKVYYVGKDLRSAWSKEFCGGPHVANTGVIGKFRIAKEEAVGAGIRRVRGVLD
jgi:alanyl-tRNA synthetase